MDIADAISRDFYSNRMTVLDFRQIRLWVSTGVPEKSIYSLYEFAYRAKFHLSNKRIIDLYEQFQKESDKELFLKRLESQPKLLSYLCSIFPEANENKSMINSLNHWVRYTNIDLELMKLAYAKCQEQNNITFSMFRQEILFSSKSDCSSKVVQISFNLSDSNYLNLFEISRLYGMEFNDFLIWVLAAFAKQYSNQRGDVCPIPAILDDGRFCSVLCLEKQCAKIFVDRKVITVDEGRISF